MEQRRSETTGTVSAINGPFVLCATLAPARRTVNRTIFNRDSTVACIYDRGLLWPGMAADVVIIDPDKQRHENAA